jgi:peptide/nickel transport system ATP-binding protein
MTKGKNFMSLLQVNNLVIRYITSEGVIEAVNGISLSVKKGESLGLVGETGAGKTTTALGILRLVPDPPGKIISGEIHYDGKDLLKLSHREMRNIRGGQISMIFQDPMTALNPILTVGEQIAEVVLQHANYTRAEARERSIQMLEMVGITANRIDEYPHQFSGGMKQRVIIACALACEPKLLIADEPTTALDVTIQAQVLEMINALQKKLNTAMILITHDLGVVAETCDSVAVMYAGEIVEYGTLEHVFENPSHPYTQGLFGSIPNLEIDVDRLNPIKGLMPDPSNLPTGCRFHPRCLKAMDICSRRFPARTEIARGHTVSCLLYQQER